MNESLAINYFIMIFPLCQDLHMCLQVLAEGYGFLLIGRQKLPVADA